MVRLSEDREADRLLRASLAAARPSYRSAVAAEVRGDGTAARAAWERWRLTTARGLTLASLVGAARMTRWLRLRAGLGVVRDDARRIAPVPFSRRGTPERFDRESDGIPDPRIGFEVGPFTEAIELFRGRVPMLADRVDRLWSRIDQSTRAMALRERTASLAALQRLETARQALSQAFWVSGADLSTTINLRELLASAIEGGVSVEGGSVTLPEFISAAKLQGAADLTDARLEVVYRNNLGAAFNDGQIDVLDDDEVATTAPLLMLAEIHDKRTRGAPGTDNPGRHWQMDGYVNTPAEFRRQGIVPPCGHNCRGGLRPVPAQEAIANGWAVEVNGRPVPDTSAIARYNGERQGMIDRGEYPDPNWVGRRGA